MRQDQIDIYFNYEIGTRPPERLDLDDWADKYRYINEVTGEKFFTSTVEVARGPMKAITETGVRTITVMCCTQLMKALDIKTPIPSPDGTKTMGELKVGDRVYDEQGSPCNVTAVTGHMQGKNCFLIQFSDGSELVADEDHQWLVDDNMQCTFTKCRRIITTKEMANTYRTKQGNRYRIPLASAVTGVTKELPVPPYVLGAWLGDGHSHASIITQHETDSVLLDFFKEDGMGTTIRSRTKTGTITFFFDFKENKINKNLCPRGHNKDILGRGEKGRCSECSRQKFRKNYYGEDGDPIIAPVTVRDHLISLKAMRGRGKNNSHYKKHIPDIYLLADESQRWKLLQGLMDTDGTIHKKNGWVSFANINEKLIDGFVLLAASLGLKPSKHSYKIKGQSNKIYHVTFFPDDSRPVFRMNRKKKFLKSAKEIKLSQANRRTIFLVEPIESRPVKCITVDSPSKLYLAGRNHIPTHNTEILLNTIGYYMHVDPCPILVVQPKDEIARKFSNVRLKQMLRASPVLRNKVEESKRRDSSDTINHKDFPGGHITIVGSRSPGNLAMLAIRVVLLDEVDRYEESSGTEGDPIDLAEERMATYSANSLSIRVCSPTTAGLSRIDESYETSDKRKPFIACPHCGDYQIMAWSAV